MSDFDLTEFCPTGISLADFDVTYFDPILIFLACSQLKNVHQKPCAASKYASSLKDATP